MSDWDYKNITGNFWNKLPLDIQKEYLEKYYPVGYHYRRTGHNQLYLLNYYSVIQGMNIGSDFISNQMGFANDTWYILNVTGLDTGDSDTIHPGAFYPDLTYWRDKKIEEMLK